MTISASLDSQTAGGSGAFPGDLSNNIAAWSNTLVPSYCSAKVFQSLGYIKGSPANTTVYYAQSSEDPSTIFLSTVNVTGSGSNNLSLGNNGAYGNKGGAYVTISGSGVTISGTNSPYLTNGSAMVTTNGGGSGVAF
jgi:hypothetical protein